MSDSMFYLVELVPTAAGVRERRLDAYGPFENGRAAEVAAKELSRLRRNKVQPRRAVVTDGWRDRVQARFAALLAAQPGLALRWDLSPVPDHFARLHPSDDQIGYYPDPLHAQIDRIVYENAGRYLARNYPELSQRRMTQLLAGLFGGESEFRIARTAEEVERVYRIGPNSCMKDEKGDVVCDSGHSYHKPLFYAGPDLAVAYLERGDRITARTVCWPDRRQHGRLYGDECRLGEALNKAGYSFLPYFEGAAVEPHIANPLGVSSGEKPAYALPYFDNILGVVLDGERFRTAVIEEIKGSSSDPFASKRRFDPAVHRLPMLCKGDDGLFRLGRYCPLARRWYEDDAMIVVDDIDGMGTVAVSVGGYDACTYVCARTKVRYARELMQPVPVHGSDGPWSRAAAEAHAFYCTVMQSFFDRATIDTTTASDGCEVRREVLNHYEAALAAKAGIARAVKVKSTEEVPAGMTLSSYFWADVAPTPVTVEIETPDPVRWVSYVDLQNVRGTFRRSGVIGAPPPVQGAVDLNGLTVQGLTVQHMYDPPVAVIDPLGLEDPALQARDVLSVARRRVPVRADVHISREISRRHPDIREAYRVATGGLEMPQDVHVREMPSGGFTVSHVA